MLAIKKGSDQLNDFSCHPTAKNENINFEHCMTFALMKLYITYHIHYLITFKFSTLNNPILTNQIITIGGEINNIKTATL